MADCMEAIGLNPRLALAYYARGTLYRTKGDCDKAVADLTEAIRLDPRLAEAYWDRGLAYETKGDHDKAIADDTQAIRLNPKLCDVYTTGESPDQKKGDFGQSHCRLLEVTRRLDEQMLTRSSQSGKPVPTVPEE